MGSIPGQGRSRMLCGVAKKKGEINFYLGFQIIWNEPQLFHVYKTALDSSLAYAILVSYGGAST